MTPIDVMKEVATLENTFKYFLERVLIIRYDDYCRLLVVHQNKVLIDKEYKTVVGAKIAFARLYNPQRFNRSDKPMWGGFYNPGGDNKPLKVTDLEGFLPVGAKERSGHDRR